MHVIETNLAKQIRELEREIGQCAAPLRETNRLFGHCHDDLFAMLGQKAYPDHDRIKAALPDYPSEEINADCTGNLTLFESVREAMMFWCLAKDVYAEQRGKPISEAKVVDFGAGWGRITRFVAKDVPDGQIFALEPNPTFQGLYEDLELPGQLIRTDYESEGALALRGADLLFCFSILTHASDRLARNIAKRWSEITVPGSVVVATIRPGSFLRHDDGEMAKFAPDERAKARRDYAADKLVYKAYADSPEWGVTVTPMSYLEEVFGDSFRIIGPRYFFQNATQLPVVMVRR